MNDFVYRGELTDKYPFHQSRCRAEELEIFHGLWIVWVLEDAAEDREDGGYWVEYEVPFFFFFLWLVASQKMAKKTKKKKKKS